MDEVFRKVAQRIAKVTGSFWAFFLAVLVVIIWSSSGRFFNYSDTWQLVINTGTTIVTFLMVFLIQNTQNRDSKAIHIKLDELIKSTKSARDKMMDIDGMSDEELEEIHQDFMRRSAKYQEVLDTRRKARKASKK